MARSTNPNLVQETQGGACFKSYPKNTESSVILADCNKAVQLARKTDKKVYKGIRYTSNTVFNSHEDALFFLNQPDGHPRACVAVKYIDTDNVTVDYNPEYDMLRQEYIRTLGAFNEQNRKQHYSPENISLKKVTCKHCGMVFPITEIKGNHCACCGQDLRPKTTLERLESMEKHVNILRTRCKSEYSRCLRDTMRRKGIKPEIKLLVRYAV